VTFVSAGKRAGQRAGEHAGQPALEHAGQRDDERAGEGADEWAGERTDVIAHGPEPRPFDRRRAIVVGVIAATVLAGAGIGALALAGDVPRGTRVLGVDLGAMSRTAAEQALHDRIDAQATGPVKIRLDGRRVQLAPADIGVSLDVDATVGRAIRGGPGDVLPVVRLDRERLEAELRRRIPADRITVRLPRISFRGVTAVPAYPGTGFDLDPAKAAEAIKAAWPIGATAEVPLVRRTPLTTRTQVDALIDGLARPAVAAPVTVSIGSARFELTPAQIAAGLMFREDRAGRLRAYVDGDRLHEAAAERFALVENAPEPARIVLRANRPRVLPGLAGMVVDLRQLGTDLLDVLGEPAPRTVTATLTRASAGPTDLAGLGIRERVSTFTTYFDGGRTSPRNRNIITIAAAVDGAVVRPGEVFSLNAHTGARDHSAGYRDAPVIVGGRLEPGVGGGASQFTTTLFNAAYYAGLQDVEHKPHSFYFSRYPAVIESTIFYPALDLKFRNTTPYGILIDTATTDRSVTVSLWSTRVFDSVRTVYGTRRARTLPPTVKRPAGPRCLTSSGLPGFTQDAWRVIRKDGREIERQKFTWRYDPEPRFVCES
jgi:vancomycin resistance protein YoaR